MKRIYLHGYWRGNLGDDLFAKIIAQRYPNANFYIYADKSYKKTFHELRNIKVINISNICIRILKRIIRIIFKNKNDLFLEYLISKMNAFIIIGGSMFIENREWEKINSFYKRSIKSTEYKCILGSNFGPYYSVEYLQQHKKLFKLFNDICFREQYTYQLFKEIENCRVAPDIVFQLEPPSQKNTKSVGISVKYFSEGSDSEGLLGKYFHKIAEIADFYIEKGFNVKLFAFCEAEGDYIAVDQIYYLISDKNKKKTERFYYSNDINLILNEFASSQYIIATRFHAMVLGFLSGKPVYPIIYSKKMSNVLYDINFQGVSCFVENIDLITPEHIFNNIEKGRVKTNQLAKMAEMHFSKLDAFIN